jgi:hypothetical protein
MGKFGWATVAALHSSSGISCAKHFSHPPREGCWLFVEREMSRILKPDHVLFRRTDRCKVLFGQGEWIAIIVAAGEELDGDLHFCDGIHQFAWNRVVDEMF